MKDAKGHGSNPRGSTLEQDKAFFAPLGGKVKAADAIAALNRAKAQQAQGQPAAHASGTHSVGRTLLGVGLGVLAGMLGPVLRNKGTGRRY